MPFPRSISSRAPKRLAILAALVVAGPALCQTGKPADVAKDDGCAGVMGHVSEAHATAPIQYTKALMAADNRCLGVTERADKARMITRDEYVMAFKRQPDCSAPAYSYMCE